VIDLNDIERIADVLLEHAVPLERTTAVLRSG
jgi:hypothetical protein